MATKATTSRDPRVSILRRLWPHSLAGQMLLSLALALFVAQTINAALIYRGQREQTADAIATAAAVRIIGATDRIEQGRPVLGPRRLAQMRRRGMTRLPSELRDALPTIEGRRSGAIEHRLIDMLDNYNVEALEVRVWLDDRRLDGERRRRLRDLDERGREWRDGRLLTAAIQRPDGQWLIVRVPVPRPGPEILGWLGLQTLILYLVLLVPVIFIVRRIARPLGALTTSVQGFDTTRPFQPVPMRGPSDIAGLIEAYNGMAGRIFGLVNEKDVMLGAIGHDLKTPLAALRVRVESVDDDTLRLKMIAGIEDITRTLDDILILARIGRPLDEVVSANITALVETVVEEFVDLGDDVTLADAPRIVAPIRVTWLRRAVRNLVANAVRYAGAARVTLMEEAGRLVIRVEDDGPGIPDDAIERLFEPFQRLEESRSSSTGGTGLGLTIARAVVEQHGGTLRLTNRRGEGGAIIGLVATINLPMVR